MAAAKHDLESAAVFGASGGIGRALVAALAERGVRRIHAGSRSGEGPGLPCVVPFRFDLENEDSIAAAARTMADDPPRLVIVASGVLTLPEGRGPERSFRQLDADAMERVFRINTILSLIHI